MPWSSIVALVAALYVECMKTLRCVHRQHETMWLECYREESDSRDENNARNWVVGLRVS